MRVVFSLLESPRFFKNSVAFLLCPIPINLIYYQYMKRLAIHLFIFLGLIAMAAMPVGALSAPKITKLSVPLFFQKQSLSCEVAALRMALAYQGVTISEKNLIKKLPFDTTPHTANTWGDPNKGFVGAINGRMNITGYGVYADPIADLARQWRDAEVMKNGTIQDLAKNIDQKRPVIIWGYYGKGGAVQWKTPMGDIITGVKNEHARLVIGYRGSALSPLGFYLLDPLAGRLYWSAETLEKNWGSLANSAVVIYPQKYEPKKTKP